jgi:hypothetical protein
MDIILELQNRLRCLGLMARKSFRYRLKALRSGLRST